MQKKPTKQTKITHNPQPHTSVESYNHCAEGMTAVAVIRWDYVVGVGEILRNALQQTNEEQNVIDQVRDSYGSQQNYGQKHHD